MAGKSGALARFTRNALSASLSAGVSLWPATSRPARSEPLDIVIPVYNNPALFERCLNALLPTLAEDDAVWLLDDASDDPRIAGILADFSSGWPTTRCIVNPENLGFVDTSNLGFAQTRRDLVLLNSDTEVTDGWLEYLQACLDRNPRAGIVCPLSDHATILSALPATNGHSRAEIAAAAAGTTGGDLPIPTAVGFCMLIRRALIEELDGFSRVFSPGYGEENDLSMRALKAGWEILAADQACVFHHSGGSFGADRASRLQMRHQAILDRIWPEYGPLVQSWWRDNPLRAKTERMASIGDTRDTVLHLLHRQYHVGGTERVARSVISALAGRFRQVLVYAGETENAWCDFEWRTDQPCRELMINSRWIKPRTRVARFGADLACPQSERALARVISGTGARVVHFHHMLQWDSLLLPAVAHALGCRVVISVHDFWFNCPVYNQLEHSTGQPCGRSRAHADQRCGECLQAWGLDIDDLSAAAKFVNGRNALIEEMLANADAVLVPSRFILERLERAYPAVPSGKIRVEPHGVSLPASPAAAGSGKRRVIGYFAGDQQLKGASLVLTLAHALQGAALTFRIYGRCKGFDPETLPPNVELMGFYDPEQVSRVMEGIDLALLPSHYEESFSMIASECWAHGVPVLSSDRGAMAERVVQGVNGWLVSDLEPDSWLRALQHVLDGDRIAQCRKKLSAYRVTSLEDSAGAHARLYQELLDQPTPTPSELPAGARPSLFDNTLREFRRQGGSRKKKTGMHCLGILRDHWGTANYRIRFPMDDLARSGHCDSTTFHVVSEKKYQVGQVLQEVACGHILIQPHLTDEGLRLMETLHRETDFRVTLVVDDLWTDLPEDNPVRVRMPDGITERLRYAAALSKALVLTTGEQKKRLDVTHPNTHVINNGLPEWIWGPLAKEPGGEGGKGGRLRLGWAGAPQHSSDLAFLAQVMKDTADLADWIFLGMCPEALRPLARELHPMVPFEQYPRALSALRLDLGIAPLTDSAFNRCKSHLKILEYGILGIPVVAADLEPYHHCPVPRAAPDNAEAWTQEIRRLLEDREARIEQARNLQRWVLGNHMVKNRRSDWERVIGKKRHA